MDRTLPGPLTDLLEYLDGIGYRDLYLQPPAGVAAQDGVGSRPDRRSVGPRSVGPRPDPPRAAAVDASAREAPPRAEAPSKPTGRSAPEMPSPAAALASLMPAGGLPQELGGRIQILASVARQAASCQACGLCRGRQTVVFGSGHPNADLMLIGEAPGGEEDRRGEPFVGPAGELLSKIIEAIAQRREGVYIANIVKCRPPNNRDPLPDEVAACRAYLEAQIDLVQPKVLVALGRVAAQALLGSTAPLRDLRGAWHEVRGIPTRATYHPAALLRNAKWKRPTWEDMKLVRDRLAAAPPTTPQAL